jgi:hypothetical protein
MQNDPFLSVKTTPNYDKGHLVQWWINPTFTAPAPYTFKVSAFQDPTVEEVLWTKDAGENFMLLDDSKIRQNFADGYAYQIELTTGDGKVYLSKKTDLGGGELTRHKYLNAAEMVRKEWVRLRFAGQFGYLLRRKMYSAAALNEVDPVTGEPIVDNKEGSFGVGHEDGYFPPTLMKFSLEAFQQKLDYHPEGRGPTYNEMIMVRTVAYPYITPHDIIVTREGRRYYVDDVDETHYPGSFFTLKQNCKCHLIANTDTVYAIGVPEFPKSDDA